ncbi:MAG: hypothetical protein A2252_05180 [Elusimicrobia bacterium RIFOXYA2_FULL_39_19]|nr:MAG: hypothetical protein A2252_05180 [Elusimicrobia bacterium RIFOXYA2_FULL_39_19]
MKKNKVNVGLVGLGVVGSGVLELFLNNKKNIEQKTGSAIEITHICDSSVARLKESSKGLKVKTSSSWESVVKDPDVDIVVELIGGKGIAKTVIIQSLENGKNVVTANKAVLAENWDEIFNLARKKCKIVYFEASVGAGIPVVQALNEGLAANRVDYIVGILNGTTNYILSKMFKENISFEKALSQAQASGFAEVNPVFDIEGVDTAHKLSILSSLAWSYWIRPEKINREGISHIDPIDIKFAYKEFGYVLKLLGVAKRINNKVELSVRPSLIQKDHMFAAVENEYNAILLHGDASGEILLYGKGAGSGPAASAVVSDLMYLARQVAAGTAGQVPDVNNTSCNLLSFASQQERYGRFYIRVTAVDKPGVLAKISSILAKYNISIAGVFQKDPITSKKAYVPILMITHKLKESDLRKAVDEIDKLPIIKSKTVLIRIEEMAV